MTIDADRLQEFFDGYGASLAAFDARASAALWGEPRAMLTDDMGGTLGSDDELVAALEQSYPLYRQLGLAGVTAEVREAVALTERTTRARVRWHFLDERGDELTTSDYEYYVVDDSGLAVRFAFGIDDTERLTELAKRKGVELPG